MGSEIGQFDEWNANEELEWDLLSFEKHRQLNLFFAEANKFYRDVPAMHENDYDWDGFQWIALDDYKNSIISFRRIAYDGSEIICVCNFQPVQHDNYVVGVPEYGIYEEVFNSEAEEFGGCGIRNEGELKAKRRKTTSSTIQWKSQFRRLLLCISSLKEAGSSRKEKDYGKEGRRSCKA